MIIPFALASAIAGNLKFYSGSITSAVFLKPSNISVGASTVIFGVFGGLIAYLAINWTTLGSAGQLRSQLCCIIGVLTVISILMSFDSSIDLAGHLGGMVGGFTSGIALFPGIKQKHKAFFIGGCASLSGYLLTMFLVFYL